VVLRGNGKWPFPTPGISKILFSFTFRFASARRSDSPGGLGKESLESMKPIKFLMGGSPIAG
jgi:hypothetical protein